MSKKPIKNQSPKEAREQRLRAQLRANLQRRKGQARARTGVEGEEIEKNIEQNKG